MSTKFAFLKRDDGKMIKAIVLDLDGTLLKEDKTVSQETINALLKFKSQSNKILFATARPPRDAYKYVPKELRDNPELIKELLLSQTGQSDVEGLISFIENLFGDKTDERF